MKNTAKYPVTVILIAVNVILFLLAELISGPTENNYVLIRWGGALTSAITAGQYWRLLTAMFVHSGIRHLVNNMLVLGVMGQHLERLTGKVRFLVIYFVSGLAANIIDYRINLDKTSDIVSVGASGAIFAVVGALLWIVILSRGRADGVSLRQLLIFIGLSFYLGLSETNVSHTAHLSGLICGFVLSLILYRRKEKVHFQY